METSGKRPSDASESWKGNFFTLHGICPCGERRKIYDFEEEYHLNKTRLVVTRVFDSKRTPQDAFVRAILNSNNADKGLQMPGNDGIIESEEPLCSSPASSVKGEANG